MIMNDIKHDLLLLLKCILAPVFMVAFSMLFIIGVPAWTMKTFIGFKTPFNIVEIVGDIMEELWRKLPEFGSNE